MQVWDLSEEVCVHSFGSYHQGLVQVVAADFQKALAASGSDDGIFCTLGPGQLHHSAYGGEPVSDVGLGNKPDLHIHEAGDEWQL